MEELFHVEITWDEGDGIRVISRVDQDQLNEASVALDKHLDRLRQFCNEAFFRAQVVRNRRMRR